MKIVENKVVTLSGLKKEDYYVALSATSKYLTKIGVKEINGMDAHDFAIEALIQSARWGGRDFISRRAKLVIIDEIRDSTGSRRSQKSQEKHKPLKILNGQNGTIFEDFYIENNVDKEMEEIIESIKIPNDLKYIIYLKVFKKLTLKQIGFTVGMSESGVCTKLSDWKEKIKHAVKINMNDKERNHLIDKF